MLIERQKSSEVLFCLKGIKFLNQTCLYISSLQVTTDSATLLITMLMKMICVRSISAKSSLWCFSENRWTAWPCLLHRELDTSGLLAFYCLPLPCALCYRLKCQFKKRALELNIQNCHLKHLSKDTLCILHIIPTSYTNVSGKKGFLGQSGKSGENSSSHIFNFL